MPILKKSKPPTAIYQPISQSPLRKLNTKRNKKTASKTKQTRIQSLDQAHAQKASRIASIMKMPASWKSAKKARTKDARFGHANDHLDIHRTLKAVVGSFSGATIGSLVPSASVGTSARLRVRRKKDQTRVSGFTAAIRTDLEILARFSSGLIR